MRHQAIICGCLPEELLDWEEKPGSESRKANLQKLRKDTRELIREKKQEEEGQKETRKPERKGRHPKYGEGEIISEDEMMIELEFPDMEKTISESIWRSGSFERLIENGNTNCLLKEFINKIFFHERAYGSEFFSPLYAF